MAGLAERLGRTFEARGFLTVEIAQDPGRDDLRRKLTQLRKITEPLVHPDRTLADVMPPAVKRTPEVDAATRH